MADGAHGINTRTIIAVSQGVARLPRRARAYLYRLLVRLLMAVEVAQCETLSPVPFVKVHEHRLLEFGLAVVDGN